MSLPLERLDLAAKLLRAQRAAQGGGVRAAEGAVQAVVGAIVADVERGEDHDPVAVDFALELPRGGEDPLAALGVVGRQQHGCLLQLQRLLGQALGQHVVAAAGLGRPPHERLQPRLVDEVVPALAQASCCRSSRTFFPGTVPIFVAKMGAVPFGYYSLPIRSIRSTVRQL